MVLEVGNFSLGGPGGSENLGLGILPVGAVPVFKGGNFTLANEAVTLHTVTAGYVLFVKQIILRSADVQKIKIGDNVSAALVDDTVYSNAIVVRCPGYASVGFAEAPWEIQFPVPLRIETLLNVFTPATDTFTISFIGWEEVQA